MGKATKPREKRGNFAFPPFFRNWHGACFLSAARSLQPPVSFPPKGSCTMKKFKIVRLEERIAPSSLRCACGGGTSKHKKGSSKHKCGTSKHKKGSSKHKCGSSKHRGGSSKVRCYGPKNRPSC